MQLPKDCYYLSDVLIENMKHQKTTFDEAIKQLTKPGYWVEVNWRESTRLQKNEIRSTPMLLVSVTQKTIERSFAHHSSDDINVLVRNGGQIFLSATVVERWGYKKK